MVAMEAVTTNVKDVKSLKKLVKVVRIDRIYQRALEAETNIDLL